MYTRRFAGCFACSQMNVVKFTNIASFTAWRRILNYSVDYSYLFLILLKQQMIQRIRSFLPQGLNSRTEIQLNTSKASLNDNFWSFELRRQETVIFYRFPYAALPVVEWCKKQWSELGNLDVLCIGRSTQQLNNNLVRNKRLSALRITDRRQTHES